MLAMLTPSCSAIQRQLRFAAEAVQRPKQKYIEFPLGRVRHHRFELGAACLSTGLVVFVCVDDDPAMSRRSAEKHWD
jgi:hypothetical protein